MKRHFGPTDHAILALLAFLLCMSGASLAALAGDEDVPPGDGDVAADDPEGTGVEKTQDEGEQKAPPDEGGSKKKTKTKKAKKKAEKSDASVLLAVSQKGATVLLDGEDLGVSPLAPLTGLTVGTHELTVDLDGFYTYAAQLEVPKTGSVRHDVLLDASADSQVELPAFMKTWWFWTAVGAVVLTAAAVGIYFGVKEEPPDAVPLPSY